MKAIYLDCFAGISGNMLLGAFLQAGVPQAYLREQLSRLPVADEFILHIDEVKKNGIAATMIARVERSKPATSAGRSPCIRE